MAFISVKPFLNKTTPGLTSSPSTRIDLFERSPAITLDPSSSKGSGILPSNILFRSYFRR